MKKEYLIFLLILSGSISLHSQEGDITEEELSQQRHLVEGNKHLLLQNYEKALNAFNKVYQVDENNSAILWGISKSHVGTGKWDMAERAIKRAIEVEPDNKWYYEHYIKILRKNRDGEKIVEVYEKLREIEPDNDSYSFKLVKYLEQQKRYKKALSVLKSMEGPSLRPEISYRKARIFGKSGNSKKAEKEYKKLAEAFPDDVKFLHLLASHYQSNNKTNEAMQIFQKIVDMDPDDSRAALALSNQLRNGGNDVAYLVSIKKIIESSRIDIDVKIKELYPFIKKIQKEQKEQNYELVNILKKYCETIVQLHPKESKAHALKGDIYNLIENGEIAVVSYEKAIQFDKSNYLIWEQFLYLVSEDKDYPKLKKYSNLALDYFPNRGRLYFFLGLAERELGDLKKAKSTLNQGKVMVGRDVRLKYDIAQLLGQTESELGNKQQAVEYFEVALSLNENDPNLLSIYAMTLIDQKTNLDRAQNLISNAIKLDPKNVNVRLAEALIFYALDHVVKSKKLLAKLVEEHPTSVILEKYGDILFLNDESSEALLYWQRSLDAGGNKVRLKRKIKSKKIDSSGI